MCARSSNNCFHSDPALFGWRRGGRGGRGGGGCFQALFWGSLFSKRVAEAGVRAAAGAVADLGGGGEVVSAEEALVAAEILVAEAPEVVGNLWLRP